MTSNAAVQVGNTPLVALDRMFPPAIVPVFAKLEMLNVGGSVKDRAARFMVEQAVASGRITATSHLVESSSGNLAIALAKGDAVEADTVPIDNGTHKVPSILEKPVPVTKDNIAEYFGNPDYPTKEDICAGKVAANCEKLGL